MKKLWLYIQLWKKYSWSFIVNSCNFPVLFCSTLCFSAILHPNQLSYTIVETYESVEFDSGGFTNTNHLDQIHQSCFPVSCIPHIRVLRNKWHSVEPSAILTVLNKTQPFVTKQWYEHTSHEDSVTVLITCLFVSNTYILSYWAFSLHLAWNSMQISVDSSNVYPPTTK